MKVRDHPPKTWCSLVCDEFFVHFSVEPSSKQHFFCRSSWELPCFKTAKHAISRVWPSFLGNSRGALDSEYLFVFHVSWELLPFVIQHVGYVVIFWVSMPGSIHSKMICLLEHSTGKLQKCKKRYVFDVKSLQTWELPTGSSKYMKNRVLFRKHRILRNKIKPQCFAPFPWSSNVNLTSFL